MQGPFYRNRQMLQHERIAASGILGVRQLPREDMHDQITPASQGPGSRGSINGNSADASISTRNEGM
jgi:hypothetical protein